jgi:hypothetical protein
VEEEREPDVFDALEIMRYLRGFSSTLDLGPDSCIWKAALITSQSRESGVPTMWEPLEIISHMYGHPSAFDDDYVPIPISQGILRAVIDETTNKIYYYNTEPMPGNMRIEYNDRFLSDNIANHVQSHGDNGDGSAAFGVWQFEHFVGIQTNDPLPADTLLFSQHIRFAPREVEITGDSISAVTIKARKGDVDGKGGINIFDALEIVKFVVGIESVIDDCKFALDAALILPGSIESGEPTIFDALEIVKRVVGMSIMIG